MTSEASAFDLDSIFRTNHRLRETLVERDLAGFRELLAPDIVSHSPYLMFRGFRFSGRDVVCYGTWAFMNAVEDFTVLDDFVTGDRGVVEFTARFHGRQVDGLFLSRFHEDGTIAVGDLIVRGFPGLAAFGRAVGPGLIRPYSRPWAAGARLLTALTVPLTVVVDVIGVVLVRRSLRRTARGVMTWPLRRA